MVKKLTLSISALAGGLLIFFPILDAIEFPKDHITLSDQIIHIFDGVPHTLDGESFDDMLHVRRAAMALLVGKPTSEGVLEGLYEFKGTYYSAEELANYEKKYGNSPELEKVLRQVVEDFIVLAEPFMKQARGTKHFMTHLISEWVQKRNRIDSQLLDWHRAEEGKEFESLRTQISSFAHLIAFCKDLIVFMEDLMYNCPKAFEQLVQKRRKKAM